MMKRKIGFCGFFKNFDPYVFPISKMILENYEVEISSPKEADYVLFSTFDEKHWFVPDNCIKIFYTGENLTPDFNACDYAIAFDWLTFGDRYMRFPLYYTYDNETNMAMENKHLIQEEELRLAKKDFCSVTISNSNRNPIFMELFEEISKYKRVDSGGRWMNNVGGPVADKLQFDKSHKFSIVCENSASPGYTTEKLVQAFAAACIPIYWGDPEVAKVFNTKSFINVRDYASVEEVARRVREIDNSDEIYYQILHQPTLISEQYTQQYQMKELKLFLDNIFCNSFETAKRRNRIFWGRKYIDMRSTQTRRASSFLFSTYWKNLAKDIYLKFGRR